MLRFLVIFLVTVNGLVNAEDCSKSVQDVCKNPFEDQTYSESFPETREELHSFCRVVGEYLNCAVPFKERCDKEGPLERKMIDVLEEVCDEDTLLHAAIVENLKCLKNVLTDQNASCEYPDPKIMKTRAALLLEQGLNPRSINKELDDLDIDSCLFTLYLDACLDMQTLDECGEVALNAYLEVQRKMPHYYSECGDDYGILLTAMVRLHRLENRVEEKIKKRK